MDLNLESKTVLITGASQGIGSAVADSFLKEGASVTFEAGEGDKGPVAKNIVNA